MKDKLYVCSGVDFSNIGCITCPHKGKHKKIKDCTDKECPACIPVEEGTEEKCERCKGSKKILDEDLFKLHGLERNIICPICKGTGKQPEQEKCCNPKCIKGWIRIGIDSAVENKAKICPDCKGTGKQPKQEKDTKQGSPPIGKQKKMTKHDETEHILHQFRIACEDCNNTTDCNLCEHFEVTVRILVSIQQEKEVDGELKFIRCNDELQIILEAITVRPSKYKQVRIKKAIKQIKQWALKEVLSCIEHSNFSSGNAMEHEAIKSVIRNNIKQLFKGGD